MNSRKSHNLGYRNLGIYNAAIEQYQKEDIQRINFNTTLSLAQLIKRMFGPKGLIKLLINPDGEFFITHKGVKVIKFLKTRLPITQLLLNMIESQENLCGDGTKSVILYTAFFLEKARKLFELGFLPQTINNGLELATKKALEVLENISFPLEQHNEFNLKNLIETLLRNKMSDQNRKFFTILILKTIERNILSGNTLESFNISNIKFRKIPGQSINESQFVNGMIIYKERPNPNVPIKVKTPKILLVKRNLDFFVSNNFQIQRRIELDDPSQYQQFLQFNMTFYRNLAEKLKNQGIDAILGPKKMNKTFVDYCASLGIIALELIGEEDIKKISEILNIKIISDVNSFTSEDVGIANLIEFRRINNDEMLFIHVDQSQTLTFLLRGGTKHVVDELEEILITTFRVIIQTLKDQKLLPGGGALECEIAYRLKKYSESFQNRLQHVISEFGTAFENLPAFLILNSAQDPLNLIPALRSAHAKGSIYNGFDCLSNSVVNVLERGIFDGYYVKKHLLKIASETARQIIRIDGLFMITNHILKQQLDKSKQISKIQKHENRLRKYFKEEEEGMFTP